MINKISFKTKIGWISAFAKEDKIFRIQFGKIKFKNDKNKVLNNFKKNSLKFYLNKIKKIEAKCKIESSIIQKKVWSELRKIKAGHTKTYGEIGKKLKISPRYVGKICGQNKLPLYIPCHRVIRSDGTLGGFAAKGGINLKKKLLNFEKSV